MIKGFLTNTHWTVSKTRVREPNQYVETNGAAISYANLKRQCRECPGGTVVRNVCTFTAKGPGSFLGWGNKILPAMWHSKKKKKKSIIDIAILRVDPKECIQKRILEFFKSISFYEGMKVNIKSEDHQREKLIWRWTIKVVRVGKCS